MRNGKVDPKMIETDSALKTRPGKHGPDQGWSVKKTVISTDFSLHHSQLFYIEILQA